MRELPAGEWICSDVPGSVAKTLMKYGQMPDRHYYPVMIQAHQLISIMWIQIDKKKD